MNLFIVQIGEASLKSGSYRTYIEMWMADDADQIREIVGEGFRNARGDEPGQYQYWIVGITVVEKAWRASDKSVVRVKVIEED